MSIPFVSNICIENIRTAYYSKLYMKTQYSLKYFLIVGWNYPTPNINNRSSSKRVDSFGNKIYIGNIRRICHINLFMKTWYSPNIFLNFVWKFGSKIC